MNWFLYIGGWFFGYWFIGIGMIAFEGICKDHGWILNEPNQYFVIGAWTCVWVWGCYKFIRTKGDDDESD